MELENTSVSKVTRVQKDFVFSLTWGRMIEEDTQC